MGNTLPFMEIESSRKESNLKMFNKGQVLVNLSGRKLVKNIIFVGDETHTLAALKNLLTYGRSVKNYNNQCK